MIHSRRLIHSRRVMHTRGLIKQYVTQQKGECSKVTQQKGDTKQKVIRQYVIQGDTEVKW